MKNIKSERLMSPDQAYAAMFGFLDYFYESYKSKDVGALLGAMSTMNDGRPMDVVYEDKWNECVDASLAGQIDTRLEMK